MDDPIPQVSLTLWRSDAIVLFDWLARTDLNTVPLDHPAVKQALTDLFTRLETDTDVPYGASGQGLTREEHGLLRMWSVHPPVLFGGGDGEDAVNWKVAARELGVPRDGPCPHCGTQAGVLFVENGLDGARFWLRCPDCHRLRPLPEHA